MMGLLFSFEGIDGAGKSTQAALLSNWMKSRGIKHILTHEPGGTRLGKMVRSLLLSSDIALEANAELLLLAADRSQHVQEVIIPALTSGKVVITDRYADATTAYQGYGRRIPMSFIEVIHQIATAGVWPSKTFYLEIDVLTARSRKCQASGSFDRLESEDISFYERVRQGYWELAQKWPDRFVVIDALRTPQEVHEQVLSVVIPLVADVV
ncbi:MAG: dTMP kinase [Acidobacteriota bacterium]|nr:dTMP kinase [Blastocatellia bacterium]MDW8411597.1 dTMP kinase [Acidobacteriota bacterium]